MRWTSPLEPRPLVEGKHSGQGKDETCRRFCLHACVLCTFLLMTCGMHLIRSMMSGLIAHMFGAPARSGALRLWPLILWSVREW